MKIVPISLPTPFYIGPVNVYLIEEDPLTLIDAGPRDEASLEALRSGLNQLGYKLSDIKRIIISHAHADHYGLARVIVEESGATAYIHEWDAPAVSGDTDYRAYRELLTASGVPREAIDRMEAGYEKFQGFAYPLDHVETLKDNDEVLAGKIAFTARQSCRPAGVPNYMLFGGPFYFVQTPKEVLILFEGDEDDKRKAISIVHTLGGTAVYEKMKLEMRSSGIKNIPRGIRKTTQSNPALLTERELDVLLLLKEGIQNKEIAARLFISAKTVDHHISSILFKLDVNSRVKAVQEAIRLEILK